MQGFRAPSVPRVAAESRAPAWIVPLGIALLAAAGAATAALSGAPAEQSANSVLILTICAFPRLAD